MKCKCLTLLLVLTSLIGYSQTAKKEISMDAVKRKSNTIVLIHGLFLNNTSWSKWKAYFEEKGYRVYAPAYPGHEGNPSDLRRHIHPDLTGTGLEDVVKKMEELIDSLPEKPIVIGHSMGGLVVQKLIEADKAIAGVSIDGAPPKNVMPPLSTFKISWPAVNFFKSNSKAYLGSREWYHKAFFNNFSESESNQLYEQLTVPESRKIVKQSALNSFAKVDFKKVQRPLLFIAGEKDAFFSPGFTQKIAQKYQDKNHSRVDYKMFKSRSHYICGEENWQEVAAYINNWINNL
ncbi:MAG TPA: alpha/beta hydrolase [Chitinophaga sp.]|nr:alpha/beta hydrolase [Chitinophaga sp.]